VIIRVFTEGQFRVDDDTTEVLNQLDTVLETAIRNEDEILFQDVLNRIHDVVTNFGMPIDEDEIVQSEVFLPDLDATITEVREMLKEDGLIPG